MKTKRTLHRSHSVTIGVLFRLAGVCLVAFGSPGFCQNAPQVRSPIPEGWSIAAARDEIRPAGYYEAGGGPDAAGCFVLETGSGKGLDGCWHRAFPISGGKLLATITSRRGTSSVGRECATAKSGGGVALASAMPEAARCSSMNLLLERILRDAQGRSGDGVPDYQRHRCQRLDRGFRHLSGAVARHSGHRRIAPALGAAP